MSGLRCQWSVSAAPRTQNASGPSSAGLRGHTNEHSVACRLPTIDLLEFFFADYIDQILFLIHLLCKNLLSLKTFSRGFRGISSAYD